MRQLFIIFALAGALNALSGYAATPALATSPPPEYVDPWAGRAMMDDAKLATAKDLSEKEFTVNTKGNGPLFKGASCPSAGFLNLKPWRARVTFEQTFSGRIIFTGTGQHCVTVGIGRIEYEDGAVYEGNVGWMNVPGENWLANFEPAVPKGTGRFTLPDGTSVDGEWLRGELVGPVTVTKPGAEPQVGVATTLAALRDAAAPAPVLGAPAAGLSAAVAGAPTDAAGLPFAPAPFASAGAVATTAPASAPGKAGPQPMLGNSGKYMCPYTEDGVVALWVDKAVKARMGGAIGGMAGAEVGKELFKNIPMFGGMFGKAAGDKMGREIAIKMAGGWEYIKTNSDQSFENVNDYVTWMRMNYKGTEHYNNVVAALKELYPELKTMQF